MLNREKKDTQILEKKSGNLFEKIRTFSKRFPDFFLLLIYAYFLDCIC